MRGNSRVNKIIMQKVIEYCEQIEDILQEFGLTFEAFDSNKSVQLSVGMCIVQIGELTTRLSDEFKTNHSDIPWRKIKDIRNIYVHDYDNVKPEKVWVTLMEDIPELKAQLEKILEAEGGLDDSQI